MLNQKNIIVCILTVSAGIIYAADTQKFSSTIIEHLGVANKIRDIYKSNPKLKTFDIIDGLEGHQFEFPITDSPSKNRPLYDANAITLAQRMQINIFLEYYINLCSKKTGLFKSSSKNQFASEYNSLIKGTILMPFKDLCKKISNLKRRKEYIGSIDSHTLYEIIQRINLNHSHLPLSIKPARK